MKKRKVPTFLGIIDRWASMSQDNCRTRCDIDPRAQETTDRWIGTFIQRPDVRSPRVTPNVTGKLCSPAMPASVFCSRARQDSNLQPSDP